VIVALLLAFCLVGATFTFHYRVLIWLGAYTPKLNVTTQFKVFVIVVVLYMAHLIEIGLYGLAYNWSVSSLELGLFRGAPVNDAMSYLYYSGVIYATLGLGDIQPEGHIRFITAMEALNGFLLITWSASFTFIAMGRLWPWENCCMQDLDSKEKN